MDYWRIQEDLRLKEDHWFDFAPIDFEILYCYHLQEDLDLCRVDWFVSFEFKMVLRCPKANLLLGSIKLHSAIFFHDQMFWILSYQGNTFSLKQHSVSKRCLLRMSQMVSRKQPKGYWTPWKVFPFFHFAYLRKTQCTHLFHQFDL